MVIVSHRVGKRDYACAIKFGKYENDRIAILLVDHISMEPICKATVNIPEADIASNEVIIKNYGENEGVLTTLSRSGIIAPWNRTIAHGYAISFVCQLLVYPEDKTKFYQYE